MKREVRVLVVDDQVLVREGIASLLEIQEGIRVVGTAADGREAVEQAAALSPDVVLMDIRMPGIDGYETTRRLRLLTNENAAVPVIALTASVIRSDVEHCLEAGMTGTLPWLWCWTRNCGKAGRKAIQGIFSRCWKGSLPCRGKLQRS